MDCVFCTLAKNSKKHLYDGENCFVVLDINPITKGHMLVITKAHYENMINVPKKELAELFSVAQDYAKISLEKLGAKGVNVGTNIGKEAGQEVMHIHVHIIPRYGGGFSKRHKLTEAEASDVLNLLE